MYAGLPLFAIEWRNAKFRPKYDGFRGRLAAGRWPLEVQTQAVTRERLHDDRRGGRVRILVSSVRLMDGQLGWLMRNELAKPTNTSTSPSLDSSTMDKSMLRGVRKSVEVCQ